jgi:DNA-binding XRE family transcriptional regulator
MAAGERPAWAVALIDLRRHHALSQEEMAERVGVDRTSVARWESGRIRPQPFHVRSICRVFDVSVEQLHLTGQRSVAPRQSSPVLGSAIPDRPIDLERLAWPTPDSRQLDDFQELLRLVAERRRTMSLEVLIPTAESTYVRLRELALGAPTGSRRRAHLVAAEAALLAGRLYYFAGRQGEAYGALWFADVAGAEAGADQLRAATRVAISYLRSTSIRVGEGGDRGSTMTLLDSAVRLGGQPGSGLVLAWALARRAEELAAGGHESAALRDMDGAERALTGSDEDALVSGPRTPEDLDGFRAAVLIQLHRPEAVGVLQRSLANLGADLVPRRAHSLTELAVAWAREDQVEAACAALSDAVTSAMRIGRVAYALRAVAVRRRDLSRWDGTHAVRALDERLLGVPGLLRE